MLAVPEPLLENEIAVLLFKRHTNHRTAMGYFPDDFNVVNLDTKLGQRAAFIIKSNLFIFYQLSLVIEIVYIWMTLSF